MRMVMVSHLGNYELNISDSVQDSYEEQEF